MNTLTKNRILEKGDQYFNQKKDSWMDVPDKDIGIQIMFSKYNKVRRPSEPEHKPISPAKVSVTRAEAVPSELPVNRVAGEPVSTPIGTGDWKFGPDGTKTPKTISPKVEGVRSDQSPKAENDKVTRPLVVRGPGESLSPTQSLIEAVNKANEEFHRGVAIPKHLMAHVTEKSLPPPTKEEEKAIAEAAKPWTLPPQPPRIREGSKAAPPTETEPVKPNWLEVTFPIYPEEQNPPNCIWTGRNGTFNGKAIQLTINDDKIQLQPLGKRGVGNCLIEFPVACIPQITGWLKDQYQETEKKSQ